MTMVHSGQEASIPGEPLSALIARLEAAEVGSRELDALVWAILRPEKIKVTGWNKPYSDESGRTQVEFFLPPKRTRTVTGRLGFPHAEPVTTSMDAALALAERVRIAPYTGPISLTIAGSGQAYIDHIDPCGLGIQAFGKTPALALCIAILKARVADSASHSPAGYEPKANAPKPVLSGEA